MSDPRLLGEGEPEGKTGKNLKSDIFSYGYCTNILISLNIKLIAYTLKKKGKLDVEMSQLKSERITYA